ncbi:MAG: radical SAM protein [Candidatus Latescibacteria bacterium]|nr:radical SAM protein [Candidatus Latescibacterota bacterium]
MRGDEFFGQIAQVKPFSQLHPRVAAFFKDYLAKEKVIPFRDHFVLNTHFPPYPSPAFDQLAANFAHLGDAGQRRLHSVTLAVTNRCDYRCWHCYNAGRSQQDLPLAALRQVAGQLQELGAVMVALSGGEPLLREDLEEIAAAFDSRTCLTLNTTGAGFSAERARALHASGVFAVGISLDALDPEEHDRRRGRPGAFRTALEALRIAGENGLYPYLVTMCTRELLVPNAFWNFMACAGQSGAREVHLLEPSATGRLAGNTEVLLRRADRQQILAYQHEVAQREDLPILSSFTYLESSQVFGCGAGLTHLYLDGSGEVCPCNLVPLSFGNVAQKPLAAILDDMGCHFCQPRSGCVGRLLSPHVPAGPLPTPPEVSAALCAQHLPVKHQLPRFFQVQSGAQEVVGQEELRAAYDQVHGDYEEFWLKEAGRPVVELVDQLGLAGKKRVLEAGCGTGFGTVLLAGRLDPGARVQAVDLSEGMLGEARQRAAACGLENIDFILGDALEALGSAGPLDLVFTSWVLGYIPLRPFLAAAADALVPQGQLAVLVHQDQSPRRELALFGELVAQDPAVLQKQVAFDFPRDLDHWRAEAQAAGLEIERLWQGQVVFRYDTAGQVLEHLLKSGAGTAFYQAIDPHQRQALERRFLSLLTQRQTPGQPFEVIHDYLAGIAGKP